MVIRTYNDFIGRDYFDEADEFNCGSISNTNTSNSIGRLGWATSSGAGTSAPVVTAGVTTHPGIISLVTGGTSGNNNELHLTDTASKAFCDPTDIDHFQWIVRIPTITSVSVRCGIGQDIASTTFGTAGAWFQFDAAVDADNWQTITRQASTSTTNTVTAVTVHANDWFLLEAVRLSGGNWEFYVNNTLQFTHSANQPTTACNVGAMVQTATGTARNLDIDYFKIRTKKLGQRWT